MTTSYNYGGHAWCILANRLIDVRNYLLQLPKNEDLQEMEYHPEVSASEGSTPWASERQSPVSEPGLLATLLYNCIHC